MRYKPLESFVGSEWEGLVSLLLDIGLPYTVSNKAQHNREWLYHYRYALRRAKQRDVLVEKQEAHLAFLNKVRFKIVGDSLLILEK